MKILILSNSTLGLLSFRKELLEKLVENGCCVTISVPEDNRNSELVDLGCKINVVKNLSRRGTNPIKDLNLLLEYKRLLKKEKPEITLTYTIKPNIYGGIACACYNIPLIANITGLGTAVENSGILQKLTLTLYRYAMRHASCIFFQNIANRVFFEDHNIRNQHHRLIPGSGVNLSKYSYKSYPSGAKIKFIYISRLMRQKGIDDYFAAAKYFMSVYDNLEFHVLGACEEDYSEVLNKLSLDGIIKYHGLQNDVRPYLTESACLVHPTFYPEGMSNVILEAAATGRPVITTRRHGCMEAIDDGITGYLFNERDTQGLINCIEKFLDLSQEQRAEMGRKARQKVEAEFDRRTVINAYLEEIQNNSK